MNMNVSYFLHIYFRFFPFAPPLFLSPRKYAYLNGKQIDMQTRGPGPEMYVTKAADSFCPRPMSWVRRL